MFEDAIVDQNPHWQGETFPTTIPRSVLAQLQTFLDIPHIISVVGVRRSGKSTLLRQAIRYLMEERKIPPRNILFLNLEMPVLSRYRNDVTYLARIYEDYLKLASPSGIVYVFLDEIQFFSEWQVFIKSRYEQKDIKFIITGSNSQLLSSEFLTLLSGRTLPVEVFPFSFSEYLQAMGMDTGDKIVLLSQRPHLRSLLDEYLRWGGFPEITLSAHVSVRREILGMYARTILYQDIAPRFAVKKPAELENLFFYLMSNVATAYTHSRLAKLVGISDKTVKDYLSFFTDAYLMFSVDSFDFSVRKQIKSPKKIYAVDVGMAGAVSFSFSENIGRLLENLVFLKLRREGHEVFYYKTSNGLEVDFMCRQDKKIVYLIQVAWDVKAEKTKTRELKSLWKAMEETGMAEGLLVTYEDEEEISKGGKTIRIVPAYKFLLGIA
jgi:uncharacterized protein